MDIESSESDYYSVQFKTVSANIREALEVGNKRSETGRNTLLTPAETLI